MAEPELTESDVTERLLRAGCVAAEEEANELFAAAPDHETLDRWLQRREAGEPLAWITGSLVFCSQVLRIDPGVYVPRLQSEDLSRRAAALLVAAGDHSRAADLCTGAGAIAAHLIAWVPAATVVGVDIDIRAVTCARRNGVPAVLGDLGAGLRSESFDLVTAVPPYVPSDEIKFLPADVQHYEPRRSLDGGDDGLDVVRQVVQAAARLLRPGGWLLVEVGGEQDRGLAPTLAVSGFGPSMRWFDVDGDLRGLGARLAHS